MRVISVNSKHRAHFSGRKCRIAPSRPEGEIWWAIVNSADTDESVPAAEDLPRGLIESVFARGATYDRTMSFQTISKETRLPLDEVEHLMMKALGCLLSLQYYIEYYDTDKAVSLKLIRGSIDQVDQKAVITWVQPRVLSRGQIGKLAERLEAWNRKLDGVAERIAPELLVSL